MCSCVNSWNLNESSVYRVKCMNFRSFAGQILKLSNAKTTKDCAICNWYFRILLFSFVIVYTVKDKIERTLAKKISYRYLMTSYLIYQSCKCTSHHIRRRTKNFRCNLAGKNNDLPNLGPKWGWRQICIGQNWEDSKFQHLAF